jgi:hypothetical protein
VRNFVTSPATASLKNAVFWGVNLVKRKRFGGKCRFHLLRKKTTRARKVLGALKLLGASKVLTFFSFAYFFLRWRWRRHVPPKHLFSQDPHGATSQKDGISHSHRCENLELLQGTCCVMELSFCSWENISAHIYCLWDRQAASQDREHGHTKPTLQILSMRLYKKCEVSIRQAPILRHKGNRRPLQRNMLLHGAGRLAGLIRPPGRSHKLQQFLYKICVAFKFGNTKAAHYIVLAGRNLKAQGILGKKSPREETICMPKT